MKQNQNPLVICQERFGNLATTFWEFSYDMGNTWYTMKPNGTQNMTPSKLIRKQ